MNIIKTTIILSFTVLSISVFSQRRYSYFQKLDKSKIKTGILYDIAIPLSGIDNYSGVKSSKISNAIVWKQIYHELYNGCLYKSKMIKLSAIRSNVKKLAKQKVYPISILYYKYNKLVKNAEKDSLLKFQNGHYEETGKGKLYDTKETFCAAILAPKLYGRGSVNFMVDSNFYYTNKQSTIKYFLIDFGDRKGYQKLKFGQNYTAYYKQSGIKTISVAAVYNNGEKKYSTFSTYYKEVTMPTPDIYWAHLKADIPYLDSCGEGDVAIFLGNGNGTLTEPVIVVDGFDPGDERPIEELYDLANQQNMLDSLRMLGMDPVLLNSHGGADYIERNGLLLVKLIDTVNYIMQQFNTYKPANQIVVIGPSMAGLITRYALTYMERNGIPHNVRNWISFDSPQLGANIPLGVQHWVRFFADVAESEDAEESKVKLETPAARQMLLYHFSATNGTTAGADALRAPFVAELDSLGFPMKTRKVAIIDGSGYGITQPYNPGDQVIYYYYRSFEVDLDGNVWAVPNNNYQQIFEGLYDSALPFDETHEHIYVDNTLPYDDAPGGYRETFKELDEQDPGYGDIIAYYDNHAFIPTISALAIENFTDPFLNVDAHINDIVTPFDKIYYPDSNLEHVEITPQLYFWFKDEVYNYPPQIITTPVTEAYQDSTYHYQIVATDKNYWNNLTFTILEKPSWLSFDETTHTLYGTPTNDDVGTYQVSIQVDDSLKTTTQNYTLTVHNANDKPIYSGLLEDQIAYADSLFIYALPNNIFYDIDAFDTLTYTAIDMADTTLPSWLKFYPNNLVFVGIPSVSDTGVYNIELIATDLLGAYDTASFKIKVIAINTATTDSIVKFNIYPNPTSGILHIDLPGDNQKTIQIFDINGKTIVKTHTTNKQEIIDMSGYAKGVYITKIIMPNKTTFTKIIKK